MNRKITLFLAMLSSMVVAEENYIELGMGYISGKDNITYIKDRKSISFVNSPIKQNIVVPVFSLQYNGFFIGTGENSEGIGYRHNFDDLSVEIAVNSYEVFENPYSLSRTVDAIDMGVVASTTMYEMVEVSLGYKNIKVDDKVTKEGTQQSANQLNFDVEAILLALGQNSYVGLGYHFTYHDSKGESNSYQKNGVSILSIIELATDYELVSQVMYTDYNFDKKNGFFSKIRDEKGLDFFVELKVDNIFNSKDFYMESAFFYTTVDSNINFFEKEYVGGSLSIGYRF